MYDQNLISVKMIYILKDKEESRPDIERDFFCIFEASHRACSRSLHFYIITFLHFPYIPMQDVALRAVRMADAIDAMICTTHFKVSFLVIRVLRF